MIKSLPKLALLVVALLPLLALGQTWTPVNNVPSFSGGTPFLMTDGTVLIQDADASDWWKLTPDKKGSYVNGTWSQVASMPNGYGPLYYASAVLPDGRLIVCGGEYNNSSSPVWTNQCAIYDPVANSWKTVPTPTNAGGQPWAQVGDTQSWVTPDGRFMIADLISTDDDILDPKTMKWTQFGSGKADTQNEEGWTIIPSGLVTVDTFNAPHTERFVYSTKQWISAGDLQQNIVDIPDAEVGAAILRYDGTVWATGGNGLSAIYTPPAITDTSSPGTWVMGPTFPKTNAGQLDLADGPAAIMVNGHVLCAASPGYASNPTQFFSFDGTHLNGLTNMASAPNAPSYVYTMLCLPNGQVLVTSQSQDIEVFTPAGGPEDAWRPTITQCPAEVGVGRTSQISGTQFNGLSQGSAYGDDSQNSTNYPIVRIINNATGDVQYCRTFGHSTMAICTGSLQVSTNFTVPLNAEPGPSTIEVVANGIASKPFAITVGTIPAVTAVTPNSASAGSADLPIEVDGSDYLSGAQIVFQNGSTSTNLATTFVSADKLTATIPAGLLAAPGSADVYVANPLQLLSNKEPFTISNPLPVMGAVSPAYTNKGAAATLTITGSGFDVASVANFVSGGKTTPLATSFVSSAKITAVLPASLAGVAGAYAIDVSSPTPGGGTSASSTFKVGDFSLSVTPPASPSAARGNSVSYKVSVAGQFGFPGPVALSLGTALPAGVTAGFNPPSIAPGAISTLTITAATSATLGALPFTVDGSNNALVHSASGAVSITDFALRFTVGSQAINNGGSVVYKVSLVPQSGFADSVNLTASQLPSGVTASFSPATISGITVSNLTLATSKTTPVSTYTFKVTGTDGGAVHSALATLVVKAGVASFTVFPTAVIGGTTLHGNATLSGRAPAGGTSIAFTTNAPGAIQMPAAISVPQGGSYVLPAFATTPIAKPVTATITATANGISKSTTVTVNPPSINGFSVNPGTVTGGASISGALTLNGPALSGGSYATISSSSPLAASATAGRATFGSLVTSTNWTGTTFPVNGDTTVTLTASYLGSSKTATLNVLEARLASMTFNPTSVVGGSTSIGTITLNAKAGPAGVTVNLVSTSPNASVPGSVKVPANATSITFVIHTTAVSSTVSASIFAQEFTSASNFVSLTKTLTVTKG